MKFKLETTYHHKSSRDMVKYLVREQILPCSNVPKKSGHPRQSMGHLCRKLNVRSVEHGVMDEDWIQSQHHFRIPNVVRRQGSRMLGWLTHSPSSLRPRGRIGNHLELVNLDDLRKLRLGIRHGRA